MSQSIASTGVLNLATIYGVLLNDNAELAHMGSALYEKPYLAPPKAPVLYIKTANTVNKSAAVPLPTDCAALEIGATVGLVIRRQTPLAAQASAAATLDDVAGVLLLADWSVPHASVYRPPVKWRNRDGFLGVGNFIPTGNAAELTALITSLTLAVRVNDEFVQTVTFTDFVRDAATLLRDVSEMFSLRGDADCASDVLMLGLQFGSKKSVRAEPVEASGQSQVVLHQTSPSTSSGRTDVTNSAAETLQTRPTAQLGDVVTISAIQSEKTLATLKQTIVSEISWKSQPSRKVTCTTQTVFCLGLNYADHAKELAFKPPEEPLVFLKSAASFTDNNTAVPRPLDATHMHYECELAIIIGKTAKNVTKAQAYDYVSGYTVANDFAIRDYLENYYRPNLRVKNRDRCTPYLEPITPAASVANPMNLALTTHVNGVLTQSGNTSDMVFDIPTLIEYLSSFMTLNAGDIILTGTPDGVVNCKVGDVVRCEVAEVGVLVNTMAGI
jgi:5-oxopent-3-ene-1,2,5-tricarboxylate decarboxylase/2-hydroxyhepta-2,4-diene-1,7-dioate isomerase